MGTAPVNEHLVGTGHWAVPGARREAGWLGSLQQTLTCFLGPQEADGLTLGRPGKLLPGLAGETAELESGPRGMVETASLLGLENQVSLGLVDTVYGGPPGPPKHRRLCGWC